MTYIVLLKCTSKLKNLSHIQLAVVMLNVVLTALLVKTANVGVTTRVGALDSVSVALRAAEMGVMVVTVVMEDVSISYSFTCCLYIH